MANLWREVVRSANGSLCTVISVLEDSGNAKITNLDLSTLGHENVLSLEISVQNLSIVDVLDSQGHLDKPIQDLVLGVANCREER